MINDKYIIRQLESCIFTCINPELAKEAATTIRLFAERLSEAEQCIDAIEDALDRGNDNDWARKAICDYENSQLKQYF